MFILVTGIGWWVTRGRADRFTKALLLFIGLTGAGIFVIDLALFFVQLLDIGEWIGTAIFAAADLAAFSALVSVRRGTGDRTWSVGLPLAAATLFVANWWVQFTLGWTASVFPQTVEASGDYLPYAAFKAASPVILMPIVCASMAPFLLAANPRRARGLALGALALSLYPAWTLPGGFNPAFPLASSASSALVIAAFGSMAAAWIRAAAQAGRPRLAWWVLIPLAIALAATAPVPWPTWATSVGNGVSRTMGGLILCIAILRFELAGPVARTVAVERSTVAAVSLAGLFVTAQIAQNVFNSSYGVVAGGLVAGALLFATRPIESALGKIVSRGSSGRGRAWTPVGTVADIENAYRLAVANELRHGPLHADNEAYLAGLADQLGLTAGQAFRLRREAEGTSMLPR